METKEIVVNEKDAKFSDCGKYRYWLRRGWDETLPDAMCIGLNPSTANATDNDTTITNLTKLMKDLGYGGFYMMNLFAFISTKPKELSACPDPVGSNDFYLSMISARVYNSHGQVFFCWGAFKQAEWRAKKIIEKFPRAMCFGKTPDGKPLHPLAATIWQKSRFAVQLFKP